VNLAFESTLSGRSYVGRLRRWTSAGRRAGITARKTARMYGTPLYVWKDGKIVAEKP